MMLLTEYDTALEIEGKVPPSLIRKVYLIEGATPQLNYTTTLFGKPIHFVYLGYNVRTAETFVRQLSGDTSNIFLIAPLSRWGVFLNTFKGINNLEVSNQFETRKQKIHLASKLIGCTKTQAKEILELFKYSFARLERNLDLLRWGLDNDVNMDELITSIQDFNYTDILYFLTGDEKSYKDDFYKALSKYRYAKNHLIKYLKEAMKEYIDYKFTGEEPPKKWTLIIKRMSEYLLLEQALLLQEGLKKCNNVEDLLKGGLR